MYGTIIKEKERVFAPKIMISLDTTLLYRVVFSYSIILPIQAHAKIL